MSFYQVIILRNKCCRSVSLWIVWTPPTSVSPTWEAYVSQHRSRHIRRSKTFTKTAAHLAQLATTADDGPWSVGGGPQWRDVENPGLKSRASIWVHSCATKGTILTPKKSRGKEILGIWAKISKIKNNRNSGKNINSTKGWFLEKMIKIDKSLATLIRKKRKDIQVSNIVNDRDKPNPTDPTKQQRYTGALWTTLQRWIWWLRLTEHSYWKIQNSKAHEEEIHNLNNPISFKEIEFVFKSFSTTKTPGSYGFADEIFKNFKKRKKCLFYPSSSKEVSIPSDTKSRQKY